LETASHGKASFHALVQDNGPFALTVAKIGGREQVVYRHAPRTLLDVFRKASRSAKKVFLVDDQTSVTYEELSQRAASYAALLSARGIRPGMRVALALSDELDWIACFVAVTSLGAVAVLAGDILDCDTAIADQKHKDSCFSAAELAATRIAPQAQPSAPQIDPDMDACIAFTSGSSGPPKGVVLTHRGLVTGLMNMILAGASAARTAPASRPVPARPVAPSILLRTPLNHVSGYMQVLLMFMLGGKIVRSGRHDIAGLIEEQQVTSVTGISDREISALLEKSAVPGLGCLRSVATVGRRIPASLRLALRNNWPSLGLGTGYGLTETCGLVCAIGNQELDARPFAVGQPLPTVECRITGVDGTDCRAEDAGEIWLRGAMVMRGYCNVPGHRMPDGWFATGDVGFMADDGMLHVLDRADRFLRIGRDRVSCRDIENAIGNACAGEVAALPFKRGPDKDGLLIVLGGRVPSDIAALKSLLLSQFPAIPEPQFVIRDGLPRTGSGKIAYARLLTEARW